MRKTSTDAIAAQQANRQYRPAIPEDAPQWLKTFARQTLDLIHEQRNSLGPLSLVAENAQAADVAVPTKDNGFGLSLQLARPGQWVLSADVCLKIISDSGKDFTLSLAVSAVGQAQMKEPRVATANVGADSTVMMNQTWTVDVADATSCQLLIRKASAGGTSKVIVSHSALHAAWHGTA